MVRMVSSVPSTGRPIGWAGIGRLLEVVEDDVVGRVVGLADLLQDHAALALDLLGREDGMGAGCRR
jgi:hypothetical protein